LGHVEWMIRWLCHPLSMPEDQDQPRSAIASVPIEQLWIELPLPQLLDTSVLFKELHGLAKGHRPRLLSAARSGTAILYVPTNVAAEIPSKFDRIASAARVPIESVEAAWRMIEEEIAPAEPWPLEPPNCSTKVVAVPSLVCGPYDVPSGK